MGFGGEKEDLFAKIIDYYGIKGASRCILLLWTRKIFGWKVENLPLSFLCEITRIIRLKFSIFRGQN